MATSQDKDAGYAIVLGKIIAHLREQRGLSQSAFAERVGVPQSRMSRIEAGQMPDALTLQRIAATLGMTVDGLHELTSRAVEQVGRTASHATGRRAVDWSALLAIGGAAALAGLAAFVVAALLRDEPDR